MDDPAFTVAARLSWTNASGRGNVSIFRGKRCLRTQPTIPTPMPLQPSPAPASLAVQTLDHEDDDIAEDQLMPPQPLLPARYPRAESATDPVPAEALVEAVPVETAVETPVEIVPVPAALDARAEGASGSSGQKSTSI